MITRDSFNDWNCGANSKPGAASTAAAALARIGAFAAAAQSVNTRRSYKRIYDDFAAFAATACDVEEAAMPLVFLERRMTADIVAGDRTLRRWTLPNFNLTIAAFRARGMLSSDAKTVAAIRGVKNYLRQQREDAIRRAYPLTLDEVLMLADAAAGDDEKTDARNAALVLLAFGFALRASEIISVKTADIIISPTTINLELAHSKTAAGLKRAPLSSADEIYHPLSSALKTWMVFRRELPAGVLFCKNNGKAFSQASSVANIVRGMASRTGMARQAVDNISLHSFRRGRVQALSVAGVGVGDVARSCGFGSAMSVIPYLTQSQ